MAATMRIPTEFTAIDKFTSVIGKMTDGVQSFAKKANNAIGKVNSKLDSMIGLTGAIKGALAGLTIGALLATAVTGVMEYESALASLEAVTGQSATKFRKQIEQLATDNKKSVIDVASSFEVIGSAMSQYLDNPEALAGITQAGITLAKASRQELEPTLQNLTSVMNQFKIGAEDANKVINQLTAGEIVGAVSTAKIAEGLQEFGASASSMGVKLNESVALLETLGKQMDHSKIAVGARNILGVLSSAKGLPKEALESLKKNGVSTTILMNKTIPLGERLKELSKIQNDAVAITKIFGKENSTAANVIFSNLSTYDKWAVEIENTNKAESQAATNSATLANRITELKDSFINMIATNDDSNVALNYTKDLLAFVGDNMDWLAGIIAGLAGAYGILKVAQILTTAWTFASSIAMGLAAFAAGGMSIAMGGNSVAIGAYNIVAGIMTGITWLMNTALWATAVAVIAATWPILAIIAAVLAVVYIFLYWDEICEWFSKQFEKFTSWIGEMWDGLVSWFEDFSFKDFFMDIGQAIINFLLLPLKSVLKILSYLPGKVGDMAQKGLDKVNELSNLGNYIKVEGTQKLESPEENSASLARENRVSGGVNVNIRDKGGNVESTNAYSNGAIPINLSPTQGVPAWGM